jgi:hypothetical protein
VTCRLDEQQLARLRAAIGVVLAPGPHSWVTSSSNIAVMTCRPVLTARANKDGATMTSGSQLPVRGGLAALRFLPWP